MTPREWSDLLLDHLPSVCECSELPRSFSHSGQPKPLPSLPRQCGQDQRTFLLGRELEHCGPSIDCAVSLQPPVPEEESYRNKSSIISLHLHYQWVTLTIHPSSQYWASKRPLGLSQSINNNVMLCIQTSHV